MEDNLIGGNMYRRKTTGYYSIVLAVLALALIWFVGHGEAGEASLNAQDLFAVDTVDLNEQQDQESGKAGQDKPKTMSHYTRLLATMAYKIHNNYMEPIEADELARHAIDGMLDELDPFSVVLERKAYEGLMEKTHGKYEGLGIVIAKRGDYITVISPFEGTPAWNMGIQAGDKIIEINGKDTKNMTVDDASDIMRGPAGTSINLTIERPGFDDPLDYEIERAVIELKSVNYAGIVDDDIGYVRLSKFSETATEELQHSIDSLMREKPIEGLILDLRSNGGGLLSQAVDVANLFLKRGNTVVSTRGNTTSAEREYTARYDPIYPDKPLIILVDGGTASASEIVSGAVQDWDRGIIIGNTTFGKGLVQQIFRTNDPDIALKLTTAKYYIPSGRCIQRPERSTKHPELLVEDEDVTIDEDADETPEDREMFLTKGGRPVYGGGGVVPDIEIERDKWQPIEINLERQTMFFEFAVNYTSKHPEVDRSFTVTDEIFEDFKKFLKEQEFTYKSKLQSKLEAFEEAVKEHEKEDLFKDDIEDLRRLVEIEKEQDLANSEDWIRRSIKREIVRKLYGETGVYEEMVLKTDPYVKKALEILNERGSYSKLLEPQEESDT
ncbi:MAG: PDZ domain-containing protein [candidate division Zixibacteria bacterium]|nr:PDZ domain-containing protein [candidate division Zixibacteria bacterium]